MDGKKASMEVSISEGTLGSMLPMERLQLLTMCHFSRLWGSRLILWGEFCFTLNHLLNAGSVGKAKSSASHGFLCPVLIQLANAGRVG